MGRSKGKGAKKTGNFQARGGVAKGRKTIQSNPATSPAKGLSSPPSSATTTPTHSSASLIGNTAVPNTASATTPTTPQKQRTPTKPSASASTTGTQTSTTATTTTTTTASKPTTPKKAQATTPTKNGGATTTPTKGNNQGGTPNNKNTTPNKNGAPNKNATPNKNVTPSKPSTTPEGKSKKRRTQQGQQGGQQQQSTPSRSNNPITPEGKSKKRRASGTQPTTTPVKKQKTGNSLSESGSALSLSGSFANPTSTTTTTTTTTTSANLSGSSNEIASSSVAPNAEVTSMVTVTEIESGVQPVYVSGADFISNGADLMMLNVAWDVTRDSVRDFFHGLDIKEIVFCRTETGRFEGKAIVTFASAADCKKAMTKTETEMLGRVVRLVDSFHSDKPSDTLILVVKPNTNPAFAQKTFPHAIRISIGTAHANRIWVQFTDIATCTAALQSLKAKLEAHDVDMESWLSSAQYAAASKWTAKANPASTSNTGSTGSTGGTNTGFATAPKDASSSRSWRRQEGGDKGDQGTSTTTTTTVVVNRQNGRGERKPLGCTTIFLGGVPLKTYQNDAEIIQNFPNLTVTKVRYQLNGEGSFFGNVFVQFENPEMATAAFELAKGGNLTLGGVKIQKVGWGV